MLHRSGILNLFLDLATSVQPVFSFSLMLNLRFFCIAVALTILVVSWCSQLDSIFKEGVWSFQYIDNLRHQEKEVGYDFDDFSEKRLEDF